MKVTHSGPTLSREPESAASSTPTGNFNEVSTATPRVGGPQEHIGTVAQSEHLSSGEVGSVATPSNDFGFQLFSVAPFSGGPMGYQSTQYMNNSEEPYLFCFEEPTHRPLVGESESLVSFKYLDSGASKQESYPVVENWSEEGGVSYELRIPDTNRSLQFSTFDTLKNLISRKLQFQKDLNGLPPKEARAALSNPGDYFVRQSSQPQGVAIDYLDENFDEKKALLRLSPLSNGHSLTFLGAPNQNHSSVQDAIAQYPSKFLNPRSA